MRFKAPKALWGFIACVIIFVVGGYDFYKRRIADPIEAAQPAQEGQAEPLQGSEASNPSAGGFFSSHSNTRTREPLTLEEYLALRTPRLADVPSSAPIYDEVTQPVTYPKLSCIATFDMQLITKNHKRFAVGIRDNQAYGCRCNTQQGTRAMISAEACLNRVENGAFDPAKADKEPQPTLAGYPQGQWPQTADSFGMPGQTAEPTIPAIPAGSFGALSSGPIVP